MPNARNILNLTFEEAIEKLRGMCRSDMIVRFCYRNQENAEVIVKSTHASVLYKDWYKECDMCPANDTEIYHLHILLNPSCTALDITDTVTFERLMDVLENVAEGHRHNT